MKLRNVFLFVLIFIVFAGCGKKESNEIKIGAILPLSGAGAQVGTLSNNAVNLAISNYNKNKTVDEPKITAISEDDKLDPKLAVSAFQKLNDVNNVNIIIGPISSGATLAIAPLANKKKVTIISTGASANAITNAGDYIFRVELSDSNGGQLQAELAYDSLKFRKMAIAYVNNDYGKGLASVFNKKFEELGGKVLINEGFPSQSTDFRTILAKIKSLNVDAIFFVFNTEITPFVKQKSELQVKSKIFTTPVFENQTFLDNLGKSAEGIIYIYYGTFNQNEKDSVASSFISSFNNNFGKPPDYYAALAYDATNIAISALKNVNYDLSKFNEALLNTKDFPGVTGNISFDKNGDVNKPVTLKIVKDGKFKQY